MDSWIFIIILLIIMIIVIACTLLKRKGYSLKNNGLETVVGEKCTVTEKIDNYAGCGQVRINGQIWSARGAFENDVFEEGETLRIIAIEGVKLVCKKS